MHKVDPETLASIEKVIIHHKINPNRTHKSICYLLFPAPNSQLVAHAFGVSQWNARPLPLLTADSVDTLTVYTESEISGRFLLRLMFTCRLLSRAMRVVQYFMPFYPYVFFIVSYLFYDCEALWDLCL